MRKNHFQLIEDETIIVFKLQIKFTVVGHGSFQRCDFSLPLIFDRKSFKPKNSTYQTFKYEKFTILNSLKVR